MGAAEPLLAETNVAPPTVNTTHDDIQEVPRGCCSCCPGGRANGYSHDICECCCEDFNSSTCCMSTFCPCVVFYRTAEELSARAGSMKSSPSWISKNAMAAGVLGAIGPLSSCCSSGSSSAGAAGTGAAGAAAGATLGTTLASVCSTIGTIVQVGLTCHFSQELKKVDGVHIAEDACLAFCCACCCTPCRMTQVYHTLTNDDIGCGCCCHPRKSHNAME